MTGEEIFVMIVMEAVCLGIGLTCLGIGNAAGRSKVPFGFWIHKKVKPEEIADLAVYNPENGKMWKRYSLWYFAAALLQLLSPLHSFFAILAVGAVFLACTMGIWLLVKCYNRILKQYRVGQNP